MSGAAPTIPPHLALWPPALRVEGASWGAGLQAPEAPAGEPRATQEAIDPARGPYRDAGVPAVVRWDYHAPSGRWMVVIQDPLTGRVLETVPPEELLEVAGRLRQVLGLLLDARG